MNRQEFEEQYAQRGGHYATAAEYFQEMRQWGMGYISLPCHCGEDGCQGWQMRSLATLRDYDLQFIPEPYRTEVKALMNRRRTQSGAIEIEGIADEEIRTGDIVTWEVSDQDGSFHIRAYKPACNDLQAGIAARDIEAGEIVQFSPIANTDDIVIHAEVIL